MKIEVLKKQGYTLLRLKPYRVQKTPKALFIYLAGLAQAEGNEYFQAKHTNGNILLVAKENLEIDGR